MMNVIPIRCGTEQWFRSWHQEAPHVFAKEVYDEEGFEYTVRVDTADAMFSIDRRGWTTVAREMGGNPGAVTALLAEGQKYLNQLGLQWQ